MSDDLAGRGPSYRIPRHSGMDPATRRLAVIAAGLGGALFVVIGAWSMLGGHGGGPVPVIAPPDGPVRVKPENPGGMKLNDNMAMFAGSASDAQGDKLAPAPEAPAPQALQPPSAPKPPPQPAPQAAPAAAPAPAPVIAPPSPTSRAAAAGEHAPARPAAEPVPRAERPADAAAGAVQVQLASLPSREQAEAEWRLLAHKIHALEGRAPLIAEANVNGQTWWRVRTGGFADEAAAKAFCEQLRAAGAACSVARF
ncbi:MAG TPA: SPOR domain-containing protein [Acetobacteraceae bacterium]|nr:SPOR domain-containing protein [Acetobacteraceae bacterium]